MNVVYLEVIREGCIGKLYKIDCVGKVNVRSLNGKVVDWNVVLEGLKVGLKVRFENVV